MVKDKDTPQPSTEKVKKPRKKLFVFIALGIVLVALVGSSAYFFIQYQNTQKLLKDPTQAAKEDTKELIAKVGKLMALPSDEVPTIATVSDKSKLRDQAFFLKSENGDKVLIYSNAKRAILYRPSTNKIIDVTSVSINDPASEAAASPAVSQVVKVALYNGTNTNGLTTEVANKLLALSSLKTEVTQKTNAQADYAESIVVDLSGKNKVAVTQLATLVKGKVAPLPAGEAKPEGVDILIILGDSYIGVTAPPAGEPTAIPTP